MESRYHHTSKKNAIGRRFACSYDPNNCSVEVIYCTLHEYPRRPIRYFTQSLRKLWLFLEDQHNVHRGKPSGKRQSLPPDQVDRVFCVISSSSNRLIDTELHWVTQNILETDICGRPLV